MHFIDVHVRAMLRGIRPKHGRGTSVGIVSDRLLDQVKEGDRGAAEEISTKLDVTVQNW